VVLDLPDVVEADPVGDLDLLEGVVQQPVLASVRPRARKLMLVEDAELHPRSRRPASPLEPKSTLDQSSARPPVG